MRYKYFNRFDGEPGISINSAAVVSYFPNPMKEESVFIELSSGSTLELKTVLIEVEKWLGQT